MPDIAKSPGQLSQQQLNAGPTVRLAIYDNGLTLLSRRLEATEEGDDGIRLVEYPVEPAEIAETLRQSLSISTGLLPQGTLWMSIGSNNRRIIAGYRPPQVTGIWLEGSDAALRVPLPGLILIHKPDAFWSYLAVVKEPPVSEGIQIFNAPLPNVQEHGSVCWGTVAIPPLTNNDLAPVWASLLGSRFATHSTEGKSRKHGDARAMLIELDAAGATAYPLDDLIPMNASPRTNRFKPTTLKDLVTEAPWT